MDKQKEQEFLEYFHYVEQSEEYKQVQPHFDKCECTRTATIGPLVELYRKSKAKTFGDWFEYYQHTSYYKNLPFAVGVLQDRLHRNKIDYSDEVVRICLKTFIIYKTWFGCEMEKKAKNILNEKEFYGLWTTPYIDRVMGVDFVMVHKGKWAFGVQVKPTSFKRTKEFYGKQKIFRDRYHLPVFYLRYNRDSQEFIKDDLDKIIKWKNHIKEQGIINTKAGT